MKRIQKTNFVRAFKKARQTKQMTMAEIAKRASLSRSYLYHLLSPRYQASITRPTVIKIGKGFRFDAAGIKKWVGSMEVKPESKSQSSVDFKDPDQQKLFNKITSEMKKQRISSKDLAQKSGLNQQWVASYVQRKIPKISKLTVARLARGLNIKAQQLLEIFDHPSKKAPRTSVKHPSRTKHFPHRQVQRPIERSSVRQIMKDVGRLNDADIAIVDLIANRIAAAERHRS